MDAVSLYMGLLMPTTINDADVEAESSGSLGWITSTFQVTLREVSHQS